MLQRLPVDQAAVALGLSVATVKRRLKRGDLRGEQEPTPSGFRWLVVVDDAATAGATAATTADGVAGVADGVAGATAAAAAATPLLSQRAEEMARYSAELLAPYVRRIEEQAEEIGALKAQLAAATSTNGQAETPSAPPAAGQAERRRWRRLRAPYCLRPGGA